MPVATAVSAMSATSATSATSAAMRLPSAALARAVADFTQRPLAQLHPSWLPADWPPAWRRADRFGPAAADVLAQPLGLAGDAASREAIVDALLGPRHDPLVRLVLLDRGALRLLAIWCGMAVHKPGFASERRGLSPELAGRLGALAGPLVGAAPLAMRRAARRYDPQAVAYILKRVPDLPDLPMNLDPIRARPAAAARVMAERGYRLLCGLVEARGALLLDALRRKFPRRLAGLPPARLTPPQVAQLRELLVLNLIPERFPTWHWLF